MAENSYVMEIKKRAWYAWLGWIAWFALLVFLAQNAIASGQEIEPRAAAIFWISFAVALIAGGVVWFVRRSE
ncbi:MAG TPA: hypothetical protein VK879_12470 [Candidatus Sulfomarinibacteraceae bacterium]|nr:hypothetical protein [Candidatus Sulfomarinibacteraceae bacterium]